MSIFTGRPEQGGITIFFQPITLEHRDQLFPWLRNSQPQQSEFTFTNLFIWRNIDHIGWVTIDDVLCIGGCFHGSHYVLPPVGANGLARQVEVIDMMIEHFNQNGRPFLMKGATEELAVYLREAEPERFIICEDRDNFDYVYTSSDLIELPGNRYRKKRNHVRQFRSDYPNYLYHDLSPEWIEPCKLSLKYWYAQHEPLSEELLVEQRAVTEILDHWRELHLTGGLLANNGQVQALSIGELLNDNTAVIHIEKGNPDMRGVYQVINCEFCQNAWSNVEFINREEDMGIAGLRQSKLSYRPVRLVPKYDILLAAQQ